MNYFDIRVIYYTILVSKLLKEPYEDVLDKISGVFKQNNVGEIREILMNKVFRKLNSVCAIDMRINYASTSWGKEHDFGKNRKELEVLKIARDAFGLIEELTKDVSSVDAIDAIMKHQKEKNAFSALVVLLLYVKGRYDNLSASSLGKALKSGEIDAGLILLFFTDKTQYTTLCAEITKTRDFFLYPEIETMLVDNYCFSKEKVANNLFKREVL